MIQRILHKWQIITLKLKYGIYNYEEDDNFNLENELDEPQLEIKPTTYLKNMDMDNNFNVDSLRKIQKSDINSIRQSNDNYSKIKKENNNKKNNKIKNSLKNKNINLDEFIISNPEDNNQKNIIEEKRKDININESENNNNNRTFEENLKNIKKNYSIEEQEEKYDNLENLIIPSTTTKKNIEKDSELYSFNNNIESNIDKNENNYITYLSDFNFNPNKSKSVDKKLSLTNIMHSKTKPWAYSYKRDYNNNNEDIMLKSKKKKPQMSNIERQALFNNLYNDGKKRQEKFLMLSMEKEAKFNSTYTFTPKVIHNKLNEKYLKNMADSKFNISKNTSNNNIRIDSIPHHNP